MHKYFFIIIYFSFLGVFAQEIKKDTLITPIDSVLTENEVFEPVKPVVFDTLSYAEEYKRDTWRFSYGVRGGISRGKFNTNDILVDRVSNTGLPVLDANGKVLKNSIVNNPTFDNGFDAGIFGRFVRGSFYLQPEIIYSQKAGKFDILNTDGSLSKRVRAKFNSIDVPLLLGIRARNARVFFGPSANFAFSMNKEMSDALAVFTNSSKLNHTFFQRPIMNFNVGVGFEFGSFFFDIKYEKGINTYTNIDLGPANSPKGYSLLADGIHLSVGLIKR
jgi:hypothetical protein